MKTNNEINFTVWSRDVQSHPLAVKLLDEWLKHHPLGIKGNKTIHIQIRVDRE